LKVDKVKVFKSIKTRPMAGFLFEINLKKGSTQIPDFFEKSGIYPLQITQKSANPGGKPEYTRKSMNDDL
jgi:hypothetical protein